MMKAVVTGATGFIGLALTHELLERGDEVTVLVRPGSKRANRLRELTGYHRIDISIDEDFSLPIGVKYDVFFHLAWSGGRNNFNEQYHNLAHTVNALRAAEKAGCRRFICTGSQAEYGETSENIVEETPLRPVTAYGAVKCAAQHLCEGYTQFSGMDLVWSRIFSVYGEHDDEHTLYSQLMKALKTGKNFSLSSDGNHVWNYLHENECAKALVALAAETVPAGIYNVASPESKPLREYVEKFRDRINPAVKIEYGKEKCRINLNTRAEKLWSHIS